MGFLRNDYILNFARYIINEYAKNESDVIAELEEIKSIKDSVTSENVKEKYEWLINYYLWFTLIPQHYFL